MSKHMTETARQRPFNPVTKAIQFRAWQIAQREGGNITREQIAAEMGETTRRVSCLLRAERWAASLRSGVMDCLNANDGAGGYTTLAEAEAIAQMGIGAAMRPAE